MRDSNENAALDVSAIDADAQAVGTSSDLNLGKRVEDRLPVPNLTPDAPASISPEAMPVELPSEQPSISADAKRPQSMPPRQVSRPPPQLPTEEEMLPSIRDGSEQQKVDIAGLVLSAAPAWLLSMVMHLLALVTLGLLFLGVELNQENHFEMVFSDTIGDQLIDDTFELPLGDLDAEELVITPELPDVVVNPLASPLKVDMVVDTGEVASSDVASPTIGIALSGREEGMKQSLLSTYGGSEITEGAVQLGLEWLKRNQRRGGNWSLRGPYRNGGLVENRLAATAMAMLAFQGAGHTHQRGKHQNVVSDGLDYLLRQLDSDGNFFHSEDDHQRLYSQAQATIVICELYAMTKDEVLRGAAQSAIDYAVRIQDEGGGWRYQPGIDSDTSVTGWFMMAFQSARMGGLDVPDTVFPAISKYLDTVASYDGSRYAYHPGRAFTEAMTAEALLCRQYLGWNRENARLRDGVNHLLQYPVNYRDQNVYYWYYATQVMRHMEGDAWHEWNEVMSKAVPAKQVKTGREAGSWAPMKDRWGSQAGRLYTTCLSIYMMEVYYRHLPVYGAAH